MGVSEKYCSEIERQVIGKGGAKTATTKFANIGW